MLNNSEIVDGVEVQGSLLFRLTTGEECDTGDCWRNCSAKGSDGVESNLLRSRFIWVFCTFNNHVRLDQKTFEEESLTNELTNDSREYMLSNFSGLIDRVITVHKNFWLNNGNETMMLADITVTSQSCSYFLNSNFRWQIVTNLDSRSPFGEPESHLIVFPSPLSKSIKAHSSHLVVSILNNLQTSVTLDSC